MRCDERTRSDDRARRRWGASGVAAVISAAVLVGVTVLFGGLAIRRLARHV